MRDKRYWFSYHCPNCNRMFYPEDIVNKHDLDKEKLQEGNMIFDDEYISSEAYCSKQTCGRDIDNEGFANLEMFDYVRGNLNAITSDRSSKNPEVKAKQKMERKKKSMEDFKNTSYGEQDKHVRKFYSDKFGWKK